MKTAIITFGRFQGFHKGHRKLFEEMKRFQSIYADSDMMIYLSKTKNKTSPMNYSTKLQNFKRIFPKYIQYVHDHTNSIIQILQKLETDYDRVYLFCGDDREESFQHLFDTYNGKEFNFNILRAVPITRNKKKESGTYIRSTVDNLSFYFNVPGSISAVHQYKKDLKSAIEEYSKNQK